ncbi:MAG: CotH kinase family protein [Bacillota bacterium]|nr:CotH kinase family protein [Bacillota bacterium]
MSSHKHIDRICIAVVVLALLLTLAFINGERLNIEIAESEMGYESRLFDDSRVHTIDIVMDDWDSFIANCESEEYAVCTLIIDGETFSNVGIRGKGNTSLSMVSSMESDRYSFKVEFDQYDSSKSYYQLDKLSLNNVIQDTTYMKDYLTYKLMNEFGVAAPLASYVYITVNGEDWGLYLAVEGVEDAFLQRNYGVEAGDLYKPDSVSMGGGRGNGRDFVFDGNTESDAATATSDDTAASDAATAISDDTAASGTADGGGRAQGFDPSAIDAMMQGDGAGFDPSAMEDMFERPDNGGGGGGMSMGSAETKLQYIDDDAASYSAIFDNAKTAVSEADQARLIASLQALSAGENLEEVLDTEALLRYFVVHNFVVNGDSYTGSMVHNYYLYEQDGRLSMIPWDYNLAFGGFQGQDADAAVNDDIDMPLSVSGDGDRPMFEWIINNDEYLAQYHQYFSDFLAAVDFAALIDDTAALIDPYVQQDPSKFYSYEEFTAGVATLRQFCLLREQSVTLQLAGEEAAVDASEIELSTMGSMNVGGLGGKGGGSGEMNEDYTEMMTQNFDGNMPEDFTEMLPSTDAENIAAANGASAPNQTASALDRSSLLLIGASCLAVIVGIVIASAFKRRRS